MNATRTADEENVEDAQAGIAREIKTTKKIDTRKNAVQPADQEDEQDEQATRVANQTDERNEKHEEEVRAVDRIEEDEKTEEELRRRRDKKEKEMKGITYTSVMVQTVAQEKKRMKRESEVVVRKRKKRL